MAADRNAGQQETATMDEIEDTPQDLAEAGATQYPWRYKGAQPNGAPPGTGAANAQRGTGVPKPAWLRSARNVVRARIGGSGGAPTFRAKIITPGGPVRSPAPVGGLKPAPIGRPPAVRPVRPARGVGGAGSYYSKSGQAAGMPNRPKRQYGANPVRGRSVFRVAESAPAATIADLEASGAFRTSLAEYNPYHDPKTGRFTSKGGAGGGGSKGNGYPSEAQMRGLSGEQSMLASRVRSRADAGDRMARRLSRAPHGGGAFSGGVVPTGHGILGTYAAAHRMQRGLLRNGVRFKDRSFRVDSSLGARRLGRVTGRRMKSSPYLHSKKGALAPKGGVPGGAAGDAAKKAAAQAVWARRSRANQKTGTAFWPTTSMATQRRLMSNAVIVNQPGSAARPGTGRAMTDNARWLGERGRGGRRMPSTRIPKAMKRHARNPNGVGHTIDKGRRAHVRAGRLLDREYVQGTLGFQKGILRKAVKNRGSIPQGSQYRMGGRSDFVRRESNALGLRRMKSNPYDRRHG